ncbi:cytochrome b/b6 domain-containing protein [Citricoccus sp. NR2]|uniref:cytochrome b/b6 domain-containing protein n=1 Tax=Citricoccus sp. NR2 TaxID=3004095 RepID=UPI0022DDE5C0|nr:cytochrome b/b6 domain-containing protein [Citricoccus sp. NR2]WBL19288.1 cytochrome b/b6 domain-containing protein [Citricoccus sp. NR2]
MGGSSPSQPEAPNFRQKDDSETSARSDQRRLGAPEDEAVQPAPQPTSDRPLDITELRPGKWSWLRRAVKVVALAVVVALILVIAARWLRTLDPVAEFIAAYPGHLEPSDTTDSGFPAWLRWQHFLNFFFMAVIVRTGFGLRSERPAAYWQARPRGFFAAGRARPPKITLGQWTHQMVDVAWVLNGLVFVVLLFATGHWARIVPTSWDVIPHATSVIIQYLSLEWPLENSWVHYNAAQQLAYTLTVFVAAPLTALTGWRVSSWWPDTPGLNRAFPLGAARLAHRPLAVYFVAFVILHVGLVLLTGAQRNLNHIFTGRDVADAWGIAVFLGAVALSAVALLLTRALFTAPVAARTGTVTRR